MTKRKPPPKKKPPAPGKRRPGRPPKNPVDVEGCFPPGARVIKRYGNRRLYDARESRSVTLDEIAAMVRDGDDVRIVDAETGEDLTRRTFLQMILDVGNQAQLDLVPLPLLRQLLVLRQGPLTRWIEQYLTAGAQFIERQMGAAADVAQPARLWQQSVELFPWLDPAHWTGGAPTATPPPPPAAEPADAEDLRGKMADLERQVAELAARLKRR